MTKYFRYTLDDMKQSSERKLFSYISFFSGGGGSSCGYKLAGGDCRFVNEFQQVAMDDYLANWPGTPNIYQSSAMSFITKLPKELDFHRIIDYNIQFEKSFVEPLKFITDKILWRIDDSYGTQGTLEEFFI